MRLVSMRASPDVVEADFIASMVKGMNLTWCGYPTKKMYDNHDNIKKKVAAMYFGKCDRKTSLCLMHSGPWALHFVYISFYRFYHSSVQLRQWPPRARGCQKLGSNLPLPGSRWRVLAWSHQSSICRHSYGRWLWFRLACSDIHNSWHSPRFWGRGG